MRTQLDQNNCWFNKRTRRTKQKTAPLNFTLKTPLFSFSKQPHPFFYPDILYSEKMCCSFNKFNQRTDVWEVDFSSRVVRMCCSSGTGDALSHRFVAGFIAGRFDSLSRRGGVWKVTASSNRVTKVATLLMTYCVLGGMSHFFRRRFRQLFVAVQFQMGRGGDKKKKWALQLEPYFKDDQQGCKTGQSWILIEWPINKAEPL